MSATKVEAAIVIGGLIAAATSGVAAYRIVGPYGDGPINVGLYRAQDPVTGRQLVYREISGADGGRVRYFFDDITRKLQEVRVVRPGQSVEVSLPAGERAPVDATLIKTGFSLRGNGVIDAWEYRDGQATLHKIEVSRRQNGRVDRWEFYTDGQLTRVEEDEDGNGRVDRWLTYERGILVQEARDRDGDGLPDPGR